MVRNVVRRAEVPASRTRPLVPPLEASVVYVASDADELDGVYEGKQEGFTYAREGHPNQVMLGARIAELEAAELGVVTCSGMSAVTALLWSTLRAGDHVLAGNQLYGRTVRILQQELPRFGVQADLVDASDCEAVRNAIRPNTRLILVEVVSNPLLRVADVPEIARLARERNILFAVDNTFPTPLSFQPLAHGAGIVLHSVTKMISGHSDVTLGCVCGARQLLESVSEQVATWGLNASPFDCWLALRGLSTLQVRLERAQSNAAALADFLAAHQQVQRVFYPGRTDHPDHPVARKMLQAGAGCMVSFELSGGRDKVNRFLRGLSVVRFAPTLGDVTTLVSHPASSSHRGLPIADRLRLGISEGLIRISVGIEDIDILKQDFAQALAH